MSLTYDQMRADIAEALDMAPDQIGDGDNLFDLGLDSMRLMTLVLKWQEVAPDLDNGRLWEGRSLGEWWIEAEKMAVGQ